ncbi:thiamine pyrophosphate-binding protein [Undibacterium sp. Di26W]|uniref:thiamine pyrophosphate-binding protein n=1 Tax=Undibacterium sp. Di26W TaxID=3413035 RepID=UPI003BF19501
MNTDKSKLVKVSDYICSRIRELTGSSHVFLLSGGGMMHLLDSVGSSELTSFPMHHEQAAAIAAYAYGRTINSTGVCFVTSGPGATNALTGVAGAFTDSVPMLLISGQVSTLFSQRQHGLRQRGFQEFNIIDVVTPTTKYARFVDNAQDVRYELEKACFLARAGRPGPVWLDLPLDVQAASIDPDSLRGFDPVAEGLADLNPAPDRQLVQSILTHLRNAKRPLIVLGHGVWLAGAKDEARQLLELLNIPVQTTWNAIDLVPEANPNYFGRANAYGPRYANFIIQNADYLLSIGARLGVQHTGYNVEAFAREAFVDMIDLDPAEASKPFLKVDRFSRCDAKALITALISELQKQPQSMTPPVEWHAYCNRIKASYPIAPSLQEAGPEQLVDPYYFVEALSDLLPDDALVPLGSSGTSFTVSGQAFLPKARQRVFHAKGMAAMGFGMPSAIGASVALNHKMAVTLVGDGGFQLNVQELQTMVHHALPIKIFVVNNGGYHAIRVTQENYFNQRYVGSTAESGVSLPSLKKIADAYGLHYRVIQNNAVVRDEIHATLSNQQPEIIEIMVDPHRHLMPKLGSYIKPDGTMASRPLEDLLPLLERDEFRANMYTKPLE